MHVVLWYSTHFSFPQMHDTRASHFELSLLVTTHKPRLASYLVMGSQSDACKFFCTNVRFLSVVSTQHRSLAKHHLSSESQRTVPVV